MPDQSGTGPAIVFSHANGFPAGTYRTLFEAWREAGYEVHAIEKLGHDPDYPVTSNWPHLRRQLADFVEHKVGRPAFLVGHSLGGFLSLMAAIRFPQLARGVVLLDSPVIYGWKARALQFAKATGWNERVSPGRVSRKRRNRWSDPDEVLKHFIEKPAFARWQPDVLADYVKAGTEADEQGRRLAFDRQVETDIYNTLPHHMGRLARRYPPACPVAFVGGTISNEVRQVGMAATQRVTQGRVSWIEGGHLFPFEKPAQASAEVLRWLREFQQGSETRPAA
jgi:pimeloyl-ACP methyl ester carboxylesterase